MTEFADALTASCEGRARELRAEHGGGVGLRGGTVAAGPRRRGGPPPGTADDRPATGVPPGAATAAVGTDWAMRVEQLSARMATSFELPCRLGGRLGGASPAVVNALAAFGRHLGVSYALADELWAADAGRPGSSGFPGLPGLLPGFQDLHSRPQGDGRQYPHGQEQVDGRQHLHGRQRPHGQEGLPGRQRPRRTRSRSWPGWSTSTPSGPARRSPGCPTARPGTCCTDSPNGRYPARPTARDGRWRSGTPGGSSATNGTIWVVGLVDRVRGEICVPGLAQWVAGIRHVFGAL